VCYAGSLENGVAAQLARLANAPVVTPQSWLMISNGKQYWEAEKMIVDQGKWFTLFK
jgi:hypothetical protein